MGLGTALSIAGTGLRATQGWAEITSRNIANATTEGYVRKDVQMSGISGGVEISAVRREVDAVLERLDRGEVARLTKMSTINDALEVYTASLGQPGDEASPAARLTGFRSSLNALAGKPGDAALQGAVLDAAKRLAVSLNDAGGQVADVAAEVELSIRYDVADVNDALRQVAELNARITRAEPGTAGHADAADALGQLVDRVAPFLDIRTLQSTDGRISLYTSGGAPLVEGEIAYPLSYTPGTGQLFAGAQEITPASPGVRGFSEGSLAGLFTLKNQILPTMQLQLDEMARALVTEFEAADMSLTPGMAGLFTDAGLAWNPANRTGLALRLSVNAAADPQAGGSLWRLRDGMAAAVPGMVGDPTQVQAFIDRFAAPAAFDPLTGIGSSMTLDDFTTSMIASQQTTRSDAAAERDTIAISAETFAAARRNASGVNSDDELQKLMLIEQAYAANAKMMTTVSTMLDALLAAV